MAGQTSIKLNESDPSYGDEVTFTVVTNKTNDPFVQLDCFQSGQLVARQTKHANEVFHLGPSELWQGGAAEAEATAMYYDGRKGTLRPIDSIQFAVAA